ncbi:uncharacterized protein BKCO1_2800091 [Diplodia corticola]|uniref:Uncharacterized protein n=1 Tax=Diplodia corticola TaxID=236234 RepID=A0A1J9QX96_9PEZI|nr:uncharacterized protein BKCO1_2800091 [Diplodia corticola]OJD33646.1 hypothetical protein BKCO1_2800091 [Diplodia corticola]
MAPVLTPLPIFGIALTATAIVTLVILHIWNSRLDQRAGTGHHLRSNDGSPFDEESGLRDRDKFRGSSTGAAPGQPGRGGMWIAAKVQNGDFRNSEMSIHLGDPRSIGEERSGRDGYHMSGARHDAGDNPFATPPRLLAIMRGESPRRLTGANALQRSNNSACGATRYDNAGGDSAGHHAGALADGPPRQPYTNYRHDTTKHGYGSSPLRYGVTLSTVTTEVDMSSIRESMSNNTSRPLSNDENHQERGRLTSNARRSSFGRSVSTLSISSSTRSKSAKRMSSRRSVSPLEVHPWRLSYT